MKSRRTSATAAAGVLVLSVLTGFAGANTASASTPPPPYSPLCVYRGDETICADANGLENPIAMLWSGDTSVDVTNWYYPTPAGDVGQIKQAGTDNCMQLEHQDSSGEVVDIVRLAPCESGEAAEQWTNSYDTYDGTDETQFISLWGLDNYGSDYCLTWEDNLSGSETFLDPCYGGDYADDWIN